MTALDMKFLDNTILYFLHWIYFPAQNLTVKSAKFSISEERGQGKAVKNCAK